MLVHHLYIYIYSSLPRVNEVVLLVSQLCSYWYNDIAFTIEALFKYSKDIFCSTSAYISTLRNNVRSRAWGAAIGCSYKVERCCIVKVVIKAVQTVKSFFLWTFALKVICSLHWNIIYFRCLSYTKFVYYFPFQILWSFVSFWYISFLFREIAN